MSFSWDFRVIACAVAGVIFGTTAVSAQSATPFLRLTIDGSVVRWWPADADARIVLRYAIARSTLHSPGAINCDPLTPPSRLLASPNIGRDKLRNALAAAFARWQSVSAIRFIETDDENAAEIVIGEQGVPRGYAFTNLMLGGRPSDPVRPIIKAAICLNSERNWKIGFDGNLASYDLVHTLSHEIGHAIGLDHPSPRGHLMSFRYDETRDGLSEGDILGAQAIYGALQGTQHADRPQETVTTHSSTRTQDNRSSIGRAFDGAAE